MNDLGHHQLSKSSRSEFFLAEIRARSLRLARLRAQLLAVAGEVVLLLGVFAATANLRFYGNSSAPSGLVEALQFIPFYVVVAFYHGAYSQSSLRSKRDGIKLIFQSFLVAAALVFFVSFATKTTEQVSRLILVSAIILGFFLASCQRILIINLLRRKFSKRLSNILIVNAGGPSIKFPEAIEISARDMKIQPCSDDPEALDRFGRLARDMDRVIISCSEEDRQDWIFVLRGLNVRGEVHALGMHELGVVDLQREEEFTTLVVSTGPLGLKDRALKRAFDLVLTIPAALFLLPVFLFVALAIKLEDGGPVLFIQQRTGRSNCHFRMFKFRSMGAGQSDLSGVRSVSKEDERVTRVGRFLRRTSIDELPQLINVLLGDMSLVGPRPHALGSRAGGKLFWEIDPKYWHRHALKPGLTGLAQIRGHRGATDFEEHLTERLQADLEYSRDWSPWKDFVILIRTAGVLVHDRAF